MIGTRTLAAGLALVAGLALTPSTRAGDTFRLDMPGPARTTTLDLKGGDDGADLVATGWYRGGFRGGFYHSGYRGSYGGYRGGYGYAGHRGYYGGYRGGYAGYYRPYYGGFYGGYRSFYPRAYYGGYGYSSGAYYGGYGYSYAYPYYYAPCSLPGVLPAMPPVVTLQSTPSIGPDYSPSLSTPGTVIPPASGTLPAPKEGTFPYDGGPKETVPMPRVDDDGPTLKPSTTIRPADERMVSFPPPDISATTAGVSPKGKWAYPAYGEEPRRTSFAEERIIRPGR